jgi:hypothetical protein
MDPEETPRQRRNHADLVEEGFVRCRDSFGRATYRRLGVIAVLSGDWVELTEGTMTATGPTLLAALERLAAYKGE